MSVDSLVAGLAIGFLVGAALWQLVVTRPRIRRVLAAGEALLDDGPDAPSVAPLRHARLDDLFGRISERLAGTQILATTDQLTGVLNRPTSLRALAAEIERASRHDRPLAVALADIDHFKRVNDLYGHAAGDVVLHHVAQLIAADLRASDLVGRYGGEEFLIVLPETEVDGAIEAAEKIRRTVSRTPVVLPDGTELTVTLSAGLAAASGAALRLDQITHDADSALYAAKALGRDQVYAFRELDEGRAVSRTPVSASARRAAADVGSAAAEAAERQLATILAPRPGWAGQPSHLIADLAVELARGLGLAEAELARIKTASLLHDVGKVAIPEELLSTSASLTPQQWQTIREHPRTGQIVLEQAGSLRDAALIALHHHERFDGRGYPNGLAGADIPIGARIVAIADAYEAMTSWRPYKQTRSPEEALAELRRCAGTQFDPALVELFLATFSGALVERRVRQVAWAAG